MKVDYSPVVDGLWGGIAMFVQAMPWWGWLVLAAGMILGLVPARRRRR